ncbi:hypothetical protein [Frankia sp. CiP1_Cm_nod2]|uniref:hypothetical protein n=1 Tax=Frankia sp. CiP1_Cm_nod2 TaxID=2897161 RepID=UPI002023E8C1
MSELESVCHALEDSLRPLPALVDNLRQRAARLRSMAAEIEQAARQVHNGPDCRRVIHGLHEAASATEASAQALAAAAAQGHAFVKRTIGGGAAHAGGGLMDAGRKFVNGVMVPAGIVGFLQFSGDALKAMNIDTPLASHSPTEMVERKRDAELEFIGEQVADEEIKRTREATERATKRPPGTGPGEDLEPRP